MGEATKGDPAPTPWHAQFPKPKSSPASISNGDLHDLINADKDALKPSYILVDVRRTDHEGGTISTSINLPAQSIYYSLSTIAKLARATGSIRSIIFYCGSSNGRGPRCAAWMQDFLDENNITELRALVLAGGIKGWVRTARNENKQPMLDLIEGYESTVWDEFMND